MQIIQEAELKDIYTRDYEFGNSQYGLELKNEVRRLECELPLGFSHGAYNITVIHRGFGALKISEYVWNSVAS